MIVSYTPSWRGIIAQIAIPIGIALGFSCLVVFLSFYGYRLFSIPDLSVSIVGAALVIFLGFRTNAAYARWWEARILWGALVNQSRSWARQVVAYTACEAAAPVSGFAREMVHWQITYVHVLRLHLRRESFSALELPAGLPAGPLLERVNPPLAILQHMALRIAEAAKNGLITEFRLIALNQVLTELTNVQGGCERIRNTPFPRQYDYYPGLFIQIYCVLLPLAVFDDVGLFTPLVTLIIAFSLLVIDQIGKNLEDPFSSIIHGIPMTALSRSIEIDLRQQLGETDLPKPVEAVNGILA